MIANYYITLPFSRQEVGFSEKKKMDMTQVMSIWQRMKDSNPHKQSQSLVCYHYTNPLSAARPQASICYYSRFFALVNPFFANFIRAAGRAPATLIRLSLT